MMLARSLTITWLVVAACGGHSNSGSSPDAAADTHLDADPPRACASWRQWGNSAAHDGASCVTGQPLQAKLADVVYDPFLTQELADTGGGLFVHYQVPLLDGDQLYMMAKKGTYVPCHVINDTPSCFDPDELYRVHSQIWSEQHFTIGADGSLAPMWSFDSDWKPVPSLVFEAMFQPALAGSLLVVPGAGGAIWELDATSGDVVRHVQPFGDTLDRDIYVAGGIAVAPDGTIYYNAIKVDHDLVLRAESQSWLVAVSPDGTSRKADYAALVPGAPAPADLCADVYNTTIAPLPWPPVDADGAIIPPASAVCGPQRPGINNTPAIAGDGTVFITSRAHFNPRYSYVAAVTPQLTPKWATSLRGYLRDGCGVTTPSDGTDAGTDPVRSLHCRPGTPEGLERVTGLQPAGQITDNSSASPVALPDGGVLYGAFTGYNSSRGHMFKLDASGVITASFDFGWDSTPAVFGGPADYKVVVKDNHYSFGPFNITELDASLHVLWSFAATTTDADHPDGFEWCINAPAVDRDGTVYANSEDGNAYAIRADGTLRDSIFLEQALGAAYTPLAIDHAGHVITLNAGHLNVLGKR